MSWFWIVLAAAIAGGFFFLKKEKNKKKIPQLIVRIEKSSSFDEDERKNPSDDNRPWTSRTDNWEISEQLRWSEDEMSAPTEAHIVYIDRKGQRSERDISISYAYLDRDEPVMLAVCHVRKENRTFLLSGIQEYIDLATGEVITDIPAHLKAVHDASPDGIVEKATEAAATGISILVTMSRIDGTMTKNERMIVKRFLCNLHPEVDPEWPCLDQALKDWGDDRSRYEKNLASIREEGGERLSQLMAAVIDMRKSRKKPNALTDSAIQIAERALAIPS